jgi:hypothetical protein
VGLEFFAGPLASARGAEWPYRRSDNRRIVRAQPNEEKVNTMRRKVFDTLASIGGLVIVAMLLVAGSLAMWGYSFANSNVQSQLAQQQIVFPVKGSPALASPKIGPYLNQYAGQKLTTGAQAKAYADHFIAVHLSEMPYGGVYSQVSDASRANPSNTALAAEVQTSFQGTTLRGLLLEAYAFSIFAMLALWAAIASFILAAVMAALVGIGFWHSRRVNPDQELFDRPIADLEPAAV